MVIRTKVDRTVLTYEHYLELPNDGRRYEIIEGELYVAPAPSIPHQYVSMSLSAHLFTHAQRRSLGRVLTAPCDVVLDQPSVVQPDILYIRRERLGIVVTPSNVKGAPDLVVEIISPSTTKTDQETKRDLYAKFGVPHYWVVEPMARWVRAYELGADGLYELVAEAHRDELFSAPPFTDLVIPLGEIWDDLIYQTDGPA